MSIEEARTEAEEALAWFDSIEGDRENGRVVIRYGVIRALFDAAAEAWDEGYNAAGKTTGVYESGDELTPLSRNPYRADRQENPT